MSEPGRIVVNGVAHEAGAADTTLLMWLREDLGLTGAKYACGESQCGACSVLVDGTLTRACVTVLGDVVGRVVTTIEGLAAGGDLHPVQHSFVEAGAMQCGFCTPGMVMAAVALLDAQPTASNDEIARWMAPNVCRCSAYPRIVSSDPDLGNRDRSGCGGSCRDAAARSRSRAASCAVGSGECHRPRLLRSARRRAGGGRAPRSPAPGMWSPTGGGWLHIDAAGRVTAFTGKVEVGQGTRRALRIAVAAELGVQLDAVALVMGDTDVCPFDVGTFGSMSMPIAAPDLRRTAAAAREILHQTAVTEGMRRVEVVEGDVALAPTTAWHVIAESRDHDDVAAVTGEKTFASDVRRPGMLHGEVLRPPTFDARLRSVDVSAAHAMGGIVVAEGEFVAVAAATRDAGRVARSTQLLPSGSTRNRLPKPTWGNTCGSIQSKPKDGVAQ